MANETIKWTTGKNAKCTISGNTLNIIVDLAGPVFLSKNEKPMVAQCFINHVTDKARIFGNLNLNLGERKASLVNRNSVMEARIKELEAMIAKK